MEETMVKKPHTLGLSDRKNLNMTGVTDVGSFDEDCLFVKTDHGDVTVRGYELQVTRLDLESGELSAEGMIDAISYSAAPKKAKKSLFKGY